MPENVFDEIAELHKTSGAPAALERLIATLRAQKQYHKLFDALMLKRKQELGLPLSRPAALQDVPESHRKEIEQTYIAAAREAGRLFIEEGDIPSAWMYLQAIREPQPVSAAIDALPLELETPEKTEEILNIALYQGANPVRGVEMMLRAHGTCSTITALDQSLHQLEPAHRQGCAKVMVRSLYQDVRDSVRRHVEQRMPLLPPDLSLRELIAGRDWVFEGGNYHVDTSHLNAVVRFARSIEPPAPELELALQLAEYGSQLSPQLQYGGEPPFDDFYPAHIAFFNALLDRNRDQALQLFRDKLAHEPDERDRPLLAYVLTDLLMRSGRLDDAVSVAAEHLTNLGEDVSFSFADLCRNAGRLDVLQRVMREKGDAVGFAAALMGES